MPPQRQGPQTGRALDDRERNAYNEGMSEPAKAASLASLLWKYRAIFLKYRTALVLGVLALVVTNLMGIAIPWQIKQAVECIQQIFGGNGPSASPEASADAWAAFHQTLWAIVALATGAFLARVASRQYLLGTGRRVEADIRNRLFAHLIKMPTAYYAAHPTGELMSRMTNDVDATKFLTGGGIMLGVNTLLAYLMVIPMMWVLNPQLTLVTFLLYPVLIYVMSRISKKVRQGYYDVQKVLAEISDLAQENLNGMTVIQSYVRENQEEHRFGALGERYYHTYKALIHERILLFMLLAALSGFSTLMVLLVGGWQVIDHRLDVAGFVAFTMYLEQLAWPTMALGWTISIFQQGTAALQRLDEVFSTQPAFHAQGEEAPMPAPTEAGRLEIRHLTFTYRNPYQPDAPENRPALTDLSLTMEPGETIALVGPVGSGKSTLLRLLPRLYEAPEGTIWLDGQDINGLDPGWLRRQVVLMPQLSFLFSSTVSHNIAFGEPLAMQQPDRRIIPAAETAAVHADIQRLPHQYQTLVGERGLALSGGQRQRVALARALLMDARVLLLDDPFSNVDADTERLILDALQARRVLHGKTTLIATHRLSLVTLADRVVLMEAGRVVAIGSHAQLLETQPLYRKLNRLQELRNRLGDWEAPEEVTHGVE